MTITLITGANNGLGHQARTAPLAAGHTAYLGARDPERGTTATDTIGAPFAELRVTADDSVSAAIKTIEEATGRSMS